MFTWFGPDLANGATQLRAVTGDFNGDGRTDLAHFYNSGANRTTLWILYSTGSALTGENLRWDAYNAAGGLVWGPIRVVQ
ncbi:hypothetical protein HDA40_002642 [Hamadaea flava]|uniref:VCBS repeat-containing protein n=1 Tax=Hamadaea flava TaxID=1742688 RepID=A0ABV8LN38_9ACTN|nr:hypothetical protein [Hamadaea flava]MCP2324135.1 hypothetical protein [Hamadaea flava]